MKEVILTDARNEKVWLAIVVVIAHRHTHAIEIRFEAGTSGDVLEVAFAVVAIKGHGPYARRGNGRRQFSALIWNGRLAHAKAGPPRAVDQNEVLSAVSIEIEERAAAAHRFGKELLA